MQCIPYQQGFCYVSRIGIAQSSMQLTNSRHATTDPNINDDGYYPFATSDATSESYGSKLSFVAPTLTPYMQSYVLRFKILIYLQAD